VHRKDFKDILLCMNNFNRAPHISSVPWVVDEIRACHSNPEALRTICVTFRDKLEEGWGAGSQTERIQHIEIPYALTLAEAGFIDEACECLNEDVRQSALQEGGETLLAEVDAAYDFILNTEATAQ
jgi:hypothetical protein